MGRVIIVKVSEKVNGEACLFGPSCVLTPEKSEHGPSEIKLDRLSVTVVKFKEKKLFLPAIIELTFEIEKSDNLAMACPL